MENSTYDRGKHIKSEQNIIYSTLLVFGVLLWPIEFNSFGKFIYFLPLITFLRAWLLPVQNVASILSLFIWNLFYNEFSLQFFVERVFFCWVLMLYMAAFVQFRNWKGFSIKKRRSTQSHTIYGLYNKKTEQQKVLIFFTFFFISTVYYISTFAAVIVFCYFLLCAVDIYTYICVIDIHI